MLSPNDHDYYNITCCIIQYVQSHNCISIIFCCSFLHESCVNKIHFFLSTYNSDFLLYNIILVILNIYIYISLIPFRLVINMRGKQVVLSVNITI